MSLILTSELIKEITLVFSKKWARNNYINYYITCKKDIIGEQEILQNISNNISIKLYSPKVSWIDPYKKNLCFCYNKYDNLSLLTFLKYINSNIIFNLNMQTSEKLDEKNTPTLFYEKGDYFYIKCYLPHFKIGDYHIECFEENGSKEKFNIPRLGCIYKSVTVDIRNIWKSDQEKFGFNLELKSIEF